MSQLILANPMEEVAAAATSTISSTSAHPNKSSSKNRPILCRLWCMLSPKKQHDKGAAAEAEIYEPPRHTPTMSEGATPPTELERVFHYFDENGDGKISPAELQKCMRAAGEELSPEDARSAVESSDSDGDGLLGMEDFVKLVEAEGEEEKGRNLRDAFGMYATEGQGCITPSSLRRMLKRLGESRSVDECARMIQTFDLNGDGVLSFDEFKIMML
ncbi:hypothetical protein OPV22_010001 [Ensete ventricosum]|uniref:EF-hand domain-containing protein n=1 Tax=Ensete ventricosum TaxID=4639 RepID=A0AAV8PUE9_ENSVE|nr:hypothetical protein OPV22_010001 [Ensete ventricosum]